MYVCVELLAVNCLPAARFPEESVAPWTSSSESCAAVHPVFAVMLTRTKRVWVAGNEMVTVLAAPGVKAYDAEVLMVSKLVPSALPCTASVWLRLSQEPGSFRTTSSTRTLVPRSVCAHWGKLDPELSQYVAALPSVMLAAPYPELELLAVAVLPAARLGPPAAVAVPVSAGSPMRASAMVSRAASRPRLRRSLFMLLLPLKGDRVDA